MDAFKVESEKKIICDDDIDNQCRLWLVYLFSTFLILTCRSEMHGKLLHYLVNLDEVDTLNQV